MIHVRRNETDLFSQPLGFDQFIPGHFSAADADDDLAVFDHRFGGRRQLLAPGDEPAPSRVHYVKNVIHVSRERHVVLLCLR